MLQILRLIAYLAVIAIGAFIAASKGTRRRAAVVFLLLYIVALDGVALVSKREMWPFGNYQALHGRGRLDLMIWRVDFVGVDRAGHEWVLDPWAFDSVYRVPLQIWAFSYMRNLRHDERQQTLAWMLGAAERSRQRLAAGKRVGAERWLGPLAIPNWYALKREHAVSPEPFTMLRLYQVDWTVRRGKENRWLVAEYPSP